MGLGGTPRAAATGVAETDTETVRRWVVALLLLLSTFIVPRVTPEDQPT